MARVHFTKNLDRHVACPTERVAATTTGEALRAYFDLHPAVRGYVFDEQGSLRSHVNVFVDGAQVRDRGTMDDPVDETSEIYVMQALSGG